MAAEFACDPQEAEVVARELTRLRSDLRFSAPGLPDGASGAVASEAVAAALGVFGQAVSATQDSLAAEVDSAARLFAGLADGTLDLDKAFADRAMES